MEKSQSLKLSRRGLVGSLAAVVLSAALAPSLGLAQEEKGMAPATHPLKGRFISMQDLTTYGLVGLQRTEPSAEWTKIALPNFDAHAISPSHPNGVSIGYKRLMELAVIGLAQADPRFAGATLEEFAYDGYGMVGAFVA